MTGEVAKTFGFLLGNRLARSWLVMDELSTRREARSFAALSCHAIAPRAALPRALANGVVGPSLESQTLWSPLENPPNYCDLAVQPRDQPCDGL